MWYFVTPKVTKPPGKHIFRQNPTIGQWQTDCIWNNKLQVRILLVYLKSESLSLLSSESALKPSLRELGSALAASDGRFMASSAVEDLADPLRIKNRGVGCGHKDWFT